MKFFAASLLCVLSFATSGLAADTAPAPVYELRIYYTHPGKMPDLLKRFREHTCSLFEKHGMVNVGYWLPVEASEQDKLYYVLRHASRDAAKGSWKAFGDDPEWKTVRDASEAAGKIVAKVDSTFLAATDYSPAEIPGALRTGAHIYELRTYTTNEGKLDALDARFREHTMKLFAKHGMTNVLYTHPTDTDKGAGKTLVYVLAHANVAAAKASFDAFRADPDWVKVRDASEANGKLLVQPPVSLFLRPVDFSALK
ncbi:MAG TPA: NIPSNAP family protein [Lacunisphaera sp.]